ncbi:MAG: divalent metal cation transporter [Methanoregula sp.]|jgi:NRAMP (natural resistance-associated macrophage protein)-like metal ion transporter|uniref:NRAMP family divalent metal transporter n=1 Tax=Methanoregula sp. TaxID=2052170 RepID=UPI003D0BD2C9
MDFGSTFFYKYRRFVKALKIYLLLAGPGLIVMLADNDAGGITTYTVTGAKYGYGLIWFLLLLLPVAYVVQEMTVRLGAVTKRGHAEAIFDAFGSFWGWFSFLDLSLVNWLTLITEFIGMTAAMSIFHIPPVFTIAIVSVVMLLMVIQGRYWTWEKIAIIFAVLNLIYIPAAFLVHPSVGEVLSQGLIPHFPGGFDSTLFFFLMANIGTTIAPWMIFFQQSAVVDKGMKEKDIPFGQMDTLIGSAFTVLVAIFVVVVTGTVLYGAQIDSAAQAATIMIGFNYWLGTFVAIGLFDAGFLGAICISLASSWAFGEVFGWAHSLNLKIREAPWFYACYLFAILTAGAVVLIPDAPLVLITLFVQVIAVTLLPAALVFLILLLNNEEIMGKYKNTLAQNIAGIVIVTVIIVLSTLYGISTLFPGLFGG